jgi:hypothetical protein
VFDSPTAEAEAREYFGRAWPSWNCWLFAAAPWAATQPSERETVQAAADDLSELATAYDRSAVDWLAGEMPDWGQHLKRRAEHIRTLIRAALPAPTEAANG